MRNIILFFSLVLISLQLKAENIFIEAESFQEKGGWVLDNQSMAQMGSPYLLAHGLGVPVENASTSFLVPKTGKYRVWVRTRDWVKSWNQAGSPGRFQVLLNGEKINAVFGTEKADWHWQDGGVITLSAGENRMELQDLTGFAGRCDAIFLTSQLDLLPPDNGKELVNFRKNQLKILFTPEDGGEYDLVVIGGGIAGCCAAISAARLGCKVALIQNRPVLGGNNSSEVRVGLSGLIAQKPYPNLGNLIDELGPVGHWTHWEAKLDSSAERSKQIFKIMERFPEKKIHNAGPASNYEDNKKLALIESQENINLFLNTEIIDVKKVGNKIVSVIGKNIVSGKEIVFKGQLFSDCTGDGTIGFLAGADYRMGRESRNETGEESAPLESDQLVMGTSVQWYSEDVENNAAFPDCPWAVQFDENTCIYTARGDWDWEAGLNNNQITEIEYIRDYALRAIYGNWDFLKNKSRNKEKYAKKQLSWVAYIGGKRESRRLLGDIILNEHDLKNNISYEDATFTTTWDIDLHYPKLIPGMKEEPFLSYCETQKIVPYAVPYRCLYSRNIDNLFMAGRNISVTHVALGTVRVMRTTGMMGEIVGMAAYLCKKHDTLPRGVYQNYLSDLQNLMSEGIGKPGFPEADAASIYGYIRSEKSFD